jgi:hypothetical protein
MKVRLDFDEIARGLGAERKGNVPASGGYFGAVQLAADIEALSEGDAEALVGRRRAD